MSDSEETQPRVRTPVASKAAPVELTKKTIEEWGAAKGLLPQVLPPADPNRRAAATLTVGSAAILGLPQRHNPNFWKFAAAKAGNAWPNGFEITESDFDAAIDGHTNLAHG